MAKIRKTKKEKLRTSGRIVQASSVSSPDENSPTPQGNIYSYISPSSTSQRTPIVAEAHSLSYLRQDLLRTTIVIGAIIIAEITLFFALTGM